MTDRIIDKKADTPVKGRSDEGGNESEARPARGKSAKAARKPRQAKQVTMTDVARAAGCSQSTVSVVLNDTQNIKISRETRDRVFSAADELGYRHQKSRSASVSECRQIAVIFDRIATSPEAVVSIDGARETGWRTGHIISVFQSFNDKDMEPLTIKAALQNKVEAIVYATIMTRQVEVPDMLYSAKIPVVLLNCYTADHMFPSVVPGEVAGGHRATDALLSAGHQRIAHITGEMWMDASKDRLKGYRRALATADIPFYPELVREGNWQPSAGYEHTHALMKLPDPPTAIFCSNDRMAVGCYEALKELGLSIPGDVSVVGYDDEEVARHLSPQLTTLVLPHRDMGRWSIETALAAQDSRSGKYRVTKLECPLVERSSIAPPRA